MDLPKPPQEIELRNIIDKLAQFVARNGPEFEQMTKNKQKGNPKFGFLYGGEHFNYYQYKVTTEQAILKQKASRDLAPSPNITSVTTSLASVSMALPTILLSSSTPVTVSGNASIDMATCLSAATSAAQWMVAQQQQQQQQQVTVQPQVPVQPQQTSAPPPITIESLTLQQTQLQDQIIQSEQNLSAQHTVLMQQQQSQIEDAIRKASQEALQRSAEEVGVNIAELDAVLQPIIDTCTKDSISAGKSWILAHCTNPTTNAVIAKCLLKKVVNPGAPFTLKLHIIYLINDVLHHCARKNADELKQALEDVVVPMFCNTSIGTTDDQQSKLAKLLKLWESKSNYFDPAIIQKMKSPSSSWSEYQASQISLHAGVVTAITTATKLTFEGYSAQHQAFVNHALQQIQTIEQQKATVEQQLQQQQEELALQQQQAQLLEAQQQAQQQQQQQLQQQQQQQQQLPPPHDNPTLGLGMINNQINLLGNPPMMNASGHLNPPRHLHTPPPTMMQNDLGPPEINFSQPPPGYNPLAFPPGVMPDFSKPPPGFPLPPPINNIPPPDIMEEQLMPSVPYYELPAGLMVPLIKLDESEYKPLDPDCIRLPPPAPPSERLLAAVEAFYAPPCHDRPRDSEGWEKLGLYEYYRAKNSARKKKEDDIFDGLREKSRSPSPIVRMRSKSKSPPKKRYRSRSRSRSKSQPRSQSRSRSRSQSPRQNNRNNTNNSRRSPPSRKLSSRPYQRSSRFETEGHSQSSTMERELAGTKKNRSRRRTRSRSRSRSRSGSLSPGVPTGPQQRSPERSPTPPSFLGSTYSKAEALRHIDESNKGHQMLRKMGWGGAGLGVKEQGIEQPISGGEVRDRTDMYKGVGINLNDPYESFRKSKGQAFINRMKARAEERI